MKPKKLSAIGELFKLLGPHRRALVGVMLCLLVLSCLNLAIPKVLGFVIDKVFRRDETLAAELLAERFRLLVWVLLALLVIYLLRNLFFYVAKSKVIVVGEQSAFELRKRLIRHLHTLSVDFYQQNKPGKISARVMLDVQSIKQFIQDEIAGVIINLLMLVVAAVIMISLDWLLAVVTLAVMPLHVLVCSLLRRPMATYATEAKERTADVSGDLIEQFDGAATVQAAASQQREQEKLSRSMRRGMRAQIKQSKYYILQKVAADLLVGSGVIVLFGVGGYSVLYKGMSAGDFVAFYAYIGLLYPRLLELVSQAGKFARTGVSVERAFKMLQIEPEVRESPDAVSHQIARARIEFRDVSFSYQDNKVLDGVSFTIEPGQRVLVTGQSGAGKSTLVNLIARFYDPQEGCILIDGVDVRDFTLSSLRRQIGIVFQDCFLFNDTIMANVRYAWPEADDEAVVEACHRAYAHEFIERLPYGYMTITGEGGVQLSQGQKRRLMIARAILKDPRILILDEPLVSLDDNARERTIGGFADPSGSRTLLVVTHYPSELIRADKQIDIRDGRVTVSEPTAWKG